MCWGVEEKKEDVERGVGVCGEVLGEVGESVLGVEGDNMEKCLGRCGKVCWVVEGGAGGCGEVLRKVCWGVGEERGEVWGCRKVLGRYGEVCWGVRGGVGGVKKCWGRCGKVCRGVGEVRRCRERCGGGKGRGVGKCVGGARGEM